MQRSERSGGAARNRVGVGSRIVGIAGAVGRTGNRFRLRGRPGVPLGGVRGPGRAGGAGVAGRPVGRRPGGFAWFGQGRNDPMRRLHGSGYRRRAVRMRVPRRYRVLLWALALAAAVVGVTAGALLAQAGG